MLLLSLAVACNTAPKKNIDEAVIENTVMTEEVKEVPNHKLIVPGKQVGALFLGQDMKDVFTLLGNADDGDAAMGSALAIWKKDSISIFSSYRDSNMVVKAAKQIATASSTYLTADHIHTGMTQTQLIDAWPAVRLSGVFVHEKTNDTLKVFDDMAGGIAFDIEQDLVSRIIVHEKGRSVEATYLSMYPGWRSLRK